MRDDAWCIDDVAPMLGPTLKGWLLPAEFVSVRHHILHYKESEITFSLRSRNSFSNACLLIPVLGVYFRSNLLHSVTRRAYWLN
jgi:hypothetical protein